MELTITTDAVTSAIAVINGKIDSLTSFCSKLNGRKEAFRNCWKSGEDREVCLSNFDTIVSNFESVIVSLTTLKDAMQQFNEKISEIETR